MYWHKNTPDKFSKNPLYSINLYFQHTIIYLFKLFYFFSDLSVIQCNTTNRVCIVKSNTFFKKTALLEPKWSFHNNKKWNAHKYVNILIFNLTVSKKNINIRSEKNFENKEVIILVGAWSNPIKLETWSSSEIITSRNWKNNFPP